MPRDPYYDDRPDRPEPARAAGGSISIAQNIGPLPVWGWGAVVIAAVFLWRRIASPAKQAAGVTGTGPTAPAYTPATGGVYLLPNGTGSAAPPAPTTPAPTTPKYLPTYPNGGPGQAPAGSTCAPGFTLIQGPNGYTCADAAGVASLTRFLDAVAKGY